MGKQPSLHKIDKEIRSLVYLLNEVPYIQTTSSCSGHPDDPSREWTEGTIYLRPIENVSAFWEFLNSLCVKLNHIDNQMLECSQQIGAQKLYSSTEPLINISLGFMLGARRKENSMEVWSLLIDSVQNFLGREKHPLLKAPVEGANFLIRQLHSTPYVEQNRTRLESIGGHRVIFRAAWDYESCKWCFSLIAEVRATLKSVFKQDEFYCHGSFAIRPVVTTPSVQRDREEHLKIWKLIELAIPQLVPCLEGVIPPTECFTEPCPEQDRKETDWENQVMQALGGDMQAYELLYDGAKQYVQEFLAKYDFEEREKLEEEILSDLFEFLHRYRPECVSFKKWMCRFTANSVLKIYYQQTSDKSP